MSDYPMLISNKLHSFRNFIAQKYEKKQLNSICNEFAQHKKIIGKKMPIFAQEYKIAK